LSAAPPVEYASTPGRFLRGALSVLVGATVAVPLAWGLPYFAAHWDTPRPDPWLALLDDPAVQAGLAGWVGLMAAAAFWLSRQVMRAGERTLRWDGQDWCLGDERGAASLMLDLGPWMLVRFMPGTGGASWLPFYLAGDLARWAALRGALWTWRDAAPRRP
jgi:hypothetical protein